MLKDQKRKDLQDEKDEVKRTKTVLDHAKNIAANSDDAQKTCAAIIDVEENVLRTLNEENCLIDGSIILFIKMLF